MMASNLTAEDVEKKYLESMGAELGAVYNRLQSECTLLNSTWRQFMELFGTNEERLHVLAWSAEHFFFVVREVFLESTLLKLSRITDPPATGKKKNVTLALLPPLVDDTFRPTLVNALQEVDQSVSFARDWRNRHIAHQDFNLQFDESAEPLAVVTPKKVRDALDQVNRFLNLVETHYCGGTIAFQMLIARGQADDLVQVLNEEYQRDLEYCERLDAHNLTEADLHRSFRKRI
jgi:hypothetical protein